LGREDIALQARQGIQIGSRLLEALVFLQSPDQLGARIFLVLGRGGACAT